MTNLENLNILITGASGGIGTSLSKAFASTKANLFLVGSSEEKISKLRNELPTRENMNYFSVDLSERENVIHFCDSIIEKYGGISIIINNAGITEDNLFPATFTELPVISPKTSYTTTCISSLAVSRFILSA